MRMVSEYERRAEECRKIATQMKDPEQKKQIEVMAQAWDLLARTRLKTAPKSFAGVCPRLDFGRSIRRSVTSTMMRWNCRTVLVTNLAGGQHTTMLHVS